ncbi:MAG: SAM-dependent methyltransferase [Bilophila wadsworthia]
MKPGKLYGVGIGPGDPRYLTFRAADVLRSVVVIFSVISQNASCSFPVRGRIPRATRRNPSPDLQHVA